MVCTRPELEFNVSTTYISHHDKTQVILIVVRNSGLLAGMPLWMQSLKKQGNGGWNMCV